VQKIWVRFGFGSYILSFEFSSVQFYMSSALQLFAEPNQNLGQKVRVRHIDGFGWSSIYVFST